MLCISLNCSSCLSSCHHVSQPTINGNSLEAPSLPSVGSSPQTPICLGSVLKFSVMLLLELIWQTPLLWWIRRECHRYHETEAYGNLVSKEKIKNIPGHLELCDERLQERLELTFYILQHYVGSFAISMSIEFLFTVMCNDESCFRHLRPNPINAIWH